MTERLSAERLAEITRQAAAGGAGATPEDTLALLVEVRAARGVEIDDVEHQIIESARRISNRQRVFLATREVEERAARWRRRAHILLAIGALAFLAALMLAAVGCRAVPGDVREAADALAEDLPLLLDVSGPRAGLTEEEIEARALLETRVRATVATLAERAGD